jgi:hypothetical protein
MKCNFVEFLQELIYLATAEENLHPTKSFQKQKQAMFYDRMSFEIHN